MGGIGPHFLTISMAEKHPLHRVWASGPFDLDGLSEAAERLDTGFDGSASAGGRRGDSRAAWLRFKAKWERGKPPW